MKVEILGVKIDKVTFRQALDMVANFLRGSNPKMIATVNTEFVMMAQKDEEFKTILNHASLSVADGVGLIWASRILKNKLPERITGVDLVWALAKLCEDQGLKMFLLGGLDGVAQEAAQRIKLLHPHLTIGSETGPIIDNNGNLIKTNGFTFSKIKEQMPDILLVAFGPPKQEKFITKHLHEFGAKVVMGVGGTFDLIVSNHGRGPVWARKLGLEWVFRTISQPKRIIRLLKSHPRFIYLVLKKKIWMMFSFDKNKK